MRKFSIAFILLITTMVLFTPVASAQTIISDGCSTIANSSGNASFSTSADFFENETIEVAVSGPGSFIVSIGGSIELDLVADGATTSYIVRLDGSITVAVEIVSGTPNSMATLSCTPADEDAGAFDGTICHIPPGNPDAAHTITVGSENAVEKHMSNHGDTMGACGDGVETRVDLPNVNISVFIIFESDSIQIFGDCTDVCEEVINTPIMLIVDLNLVVVSGDEGLVFITVEDPEDFGFLLDDASTDGVYVVIYYLHPDPEDATVGVFQINIYQDGELLDDSILVFINTDGEIVSWTSHNIWDEADDS